MGDQVDAFAYAVTQQMIQYQVVLEYRDGVNAFLLGPFESRGEAKCVLRSQLDERWLEFKGGHVRSYDDGPPLNMFNRSPIWVLCSAKGVPGGKYRPVEAD